MSLSRRVGRRIPFRVLFFFFSTFYFILELPRCHGGEEFAFQRRRHKRHECDAWIWKIPWRRKRQPTTVCLPGKSLGQRSMESYSPWVAKSLAWLSTQVANNNAVIVSGGEQRDSAIHNTGIHSPQTYNIEYQLDAKHLAQCLALNSCSMNKYNGNNCATGARIQRKTSGT